MHPQSTTTSTPTKPPAVSGIYRITNIITGETYIGSSVNIRARWSAHRAYLRARKHVNPRLQAAWDAQGEAALVLTVVEEAAPERLFVLEQGYLNRERPVYNVSLCARGGPKIKKHSAETRALISARVKAAGKTPEHIAKLRAHMLKVRPTQLSAERRRQIAAFHTGRKRTPETRAKISDANRGRVVSAETRQKIAVAHQGLPTHKWTVEQRQRVSAAKREWWRLRRERGRQSGGAHGQASADAGYRQLPLPGTQDCCWSTDSDVGSGSSANTAAVL